MPMGTLLVPLRSTCRQFWHVALDKVNKLCDPRLHKPFVEIKVILKNRTKRVEKTLQRHMREEVRKWRKRNLSQERWEKEENKN